MAPIASRLRLPVQVQDAMLAVFVTLFQILGTVRAAGNQPAHDGQHEAQGAGAEDRDPERREPRAVAVADAVDRAAAEPGDGDRHHHRDGREQCRYRQAEPVGPQPAQQSHEGRHAGPC